MPVQGAGPIAEPVVASLPAAVPIVVDTRDHPASSARVRTSRRRSKDAPLVALCVVLVIALLVLVPLVIWAIRYR
jgi:hypothetical protein